MHMLAINIHGSGDPQGLAVSQVIPSLLGDLQFWGVPGDPQPLGKSGDPQLGMWA